MRWIPTLKVALWLSVLLGIVVSPAFAAVQLPAPAEAPAADSPRYQVYLLTMDRGDAIWELFGHNAILIQDAATGEELAWNWGLFDFQQEAFIPRFLRGTMEYTMGPARLGPFLDSYAAANRTVYANQIHLTQEEAAALDAFIQWNFEPENRAYAYDYFRDNCSTRVRDALDGVLGGTLRATFGDVPTDRSYRWHTRRLVQERDWLDQGISFLFGMPTDRPITAWESTFLPMELLRLLEGVTRPDALGAAQPLLGPRLTLFEADRDPLPASPPAFSLLWVALGLGLAGAVVAVGRRAALGHRANRVILQALVTVWGLFAGLLGLLVVLGWFSHHRVVHWNLNLFYLSPLLLALPFLASGIGKKVDESAAVAGGKAARLTLVVAALSVVAALAQMTPFVSQGNAEAMAVGLPMNLALAWVFTRSWRGAPADAR